MDRRWLNQYSKQLIIFVSFGWIGFLIVMQIVRLSRHWLFDIPMSISWQAISFTLDALVGIFILTLTILSSIYLIQRRIPLIILFSIHLVQGFLFTMSGYFFIYLGLKLLNQPGMVNFSAAYFYQLQQNILIYILGVTVVYVFMYLKESQFKEIEKNLLTTKLLEAQFANLKSQLHPHFLFNTHNSIKVLIDENPKEAKKILTDLSDLLRHILDRQQKTKISLREELAFLEKYVHIEKTRFSDHLFIKIHCESVAYDELIPPMLLQPLVENAIKHGFSNDHLSLKIEVFIQKKASDLHIEVRDDGRGFDAATLEGIFFTGTGIANLKERLEHLYADQYAFILENRASGGALVKIKLPLS